MKKRNTRRAALALLAGFLLGLHKGKLTLWRDGSAHPVQVYDIRESTLPPADRLLLRRGIRIGSTEELWMVLENYLD